MTPRAPAIRDATGEDAPALARFAVQCFEDAFGSRNDPADLALHYAETYHPDTLARDIAAADCEYLLALDDGELVAFAALRHGAVPPGVDAASPVELKRFYVDRTRHGRGIAPLLMDTVLARARGRGGRTLWLTTWEHAAQARRFYAKHGFEDVGSARFTVGRSLQTDRLLLRVL